jgi:uncharacterized protein (TIRG00374 family)
LVVGGGLSIAGIVLATRGIDLGEVGSAISDATPLWLAFGALAILASYPLLALRWRIIATDLRPPILSKMVELEFIGAAVNNALPARLGEVARSVGLARESSRPVLQAFGTVVVDRVADVVFFAVAFGATVAVSPTPSWVRWLGVAGAILTVLAVVTIALVSLWLRRSVDQKPDGALRRQLLSLAEGLRCVRTPGIFWRSMALTGAAWGVWMAGAWLVGESLGITLSLPELLFTTSLLGLGSAVPSAPGFIGTYHWIAASALGLFGVGSSEALAFAVLLHAAWFVPTTLVGCLLMVRWGLDFAGLRRASVASQPVEG